MPSNKQMLSAVLLAAVSAASVTISTGAEAARVFNRSVVENDLPYDGFIVRYKSGTTARTDLAVARGGITRLGTRLVISRAIDASFKANPKRPFDFGLVRQLSNEAHLLRASRKLSRVEAQATIDALIEDPTVEYVEPNVIHYEHVTPNDPMFNQQWGFGESGIRAEKAWDLAAGAGVTVAVLDTGITNHPDLNGNVVAGYDLIADLQSAGDGDARDADATDAGSMCPESGRPYATWHGTHVAGTVAASTNNGLGVAGTAFGARIMPVRVMGRCGGSTADITDAINWSSGGDVPGIPTLPIAKTAKVLNLSLGGPGACSPTYIEAINKAISRGATVVVSAGNSSEQVENVQPANCPGVLTVAAVDRDNFQATFSNFGSKVDVSAPGVGILSTMNAGTTAVTTPTYGEKSGTSMAAPHVSGVVALVQSRRLALGLPLLSADSVRNLIKATSRPMVGTCATGGCGEGVIDAAAAVAAATWSAIPLKRQVDASGKLQVLLLERTASAAASQFTDFAIDVPEGYVVIGGGVRGAGAPKAHLLTASYPNAARSAWLVSTREAQAGNPATIRGWALALKVEGMTRTELLSNMTYRVTIGTASSNPTASSSLPAGYTRLGGGFQVSSNTASNFVWSSAPGSGTSWAVAAKEQGVSSVASIRSHVIGLRNNLPVGVVTSTVSFAESTEVQALPVVTASVAEGHVLTGCGARVNWAGGVGNLLWQIEPKILAGAATCEARGTEHLYSSPATIGAYSLGIRLN